MKQALARQPSVETVEQELAIPPAHKRAIGKLLPYRRAISTADDCNSAEKGLLWINAQIKAIKHNAVWLSVFAPAKATVDALLAVQQNALKPYLSKERGRTLDQDLRDSISRYRTAEERARVNAQAKLTKTLTRQLAAAPVDEPLVVERGSDVFEFTPETIDSGSIVTLQPSASDTASTRKYWHMALVDPAKPRDKEGTILTNEEAGIKALAAAIAAGKAPWHFLQLNTKATDAHATEHEDRLTFPGLVPYCELRPVLNRK